MNIIRKVAKWFFVVAALLLILFFSISGPIDRSPIQQEEFYQETLRSIDTAHVAISASKDVLYTGWAKVNITPSYPMPLAGYKMRDNFNAVHDSLFCRILAFKVNDATAFVLSVDLLLFPPVIKERLQNYFSGKNSNVFFYFSATHTHNGIGGWDDSVIGNLVLGSYEEAWVNKATQDLINSIEALSENLKPSTLSYFETEHTGLAENRVDINSPADSKLRGFRIIRKDSSKAILFAFSAHATSISKKSLSLSGDYPAAVITKLEANGFHFATYLSGMVGSHRLAGIAEQEFEMVNKTGEVLADKILKASYQQPLDLLSLRAMHLAIQFAPSQLRVTKDWKIRDWVFKLFLHKLEGELTILELGNIMLLGTPCDFSGEISVQDSFDSLAKKANKKLIITSFNGNYDGYITADHHYETSEKEEIMALNWVGPYYGNYFSALIKKVISKKE